MTANQSLLKDIGAWYTINGSGSITGISRVIFSIGQAIAPIACSALFELVGVWAPLAATGLLYAILLPVNMLIGIPLLSNVSPPEDFVAASAARAPAPANQAKAVADASAGVNLTDAPAVEAEAAGTPAGEPGGS